MERVNNPEEIQELLQVLVGRRPWDVSTSKIGSFLTFEFGSRLPPKRPNLKPYGEWHLWVYCCHWNVSLNDTIILNQGFSRILKSSIIDKLENRCVLSVDFDIKTFITTFVFEGGYIMRLIPNKDNLIDWIFFTPEFVFTLKPNKTWSCDHL
jgi:hypothetical protein